VYDWNNIINQEALFEIKKAQFGVQKSEFQPKDPT
jgi:hypothetical protein